MTIEQYGKIIDKVNSDSFEKQIFIEIERYLKDRGMKVYDINYDDYKRMREYLYRINREGLVMKLSDGKDPNDRKEIFKDDMKQLLKAIISAGICAVLAFLYEPTAMFCIAGGVILFAVFISRMSFFPYMNTDYPRRMIKAHEDAMLNTQAYLFQANLHSNQIKYILDKINKE